LGRVQGGDAPPAPVELVSEKLRAEGSQLLCLNSEF
jgi:hypothetical protein